MFPLCHVALLGLLPKFSQVLLVTVSCNLIISVPLGQKHLDSRHHAQASPLGQTMLWGLIVGATRTWSSR